MIDSQYEKATIYTGNDLRTIAHSKTVREISKLSLPEIDGLVEKIARIAPAGNVPGVILNGLANLKQKQLPPETVRRDIGLIFRGIEQSLKDHAVYTTFFAGPAAVIYAYQSLLKLAGKNPDSAFAYGTWDFYTKYALRDDTARHTCETHGFATTLRQHNIQLSEIDKLTAWVMTAVHGLHQYPALLENEWRERVHPHLLIAHAPEMADLYRQWEKQRPFTRGHDAHPKEDYPAYRRRQFDQFMMAATLDLPKATIKKWQADIQAITAASLPHYQRQMSIRAFLKPGKYHEERQLFKEDEPVYVGIIHNSRYYLLKSCQDNDHTKPVSVQTVRQQIAAIFNHPALNTPQTLTPSARIKRHDWFNISQKLTCLPEIKGLHAAPIWINTARQPRDLPLAQIRQAERGIGDHPLTLFFTDETAVFDLSHIFFDGAWGVSLAEIMTGEALAWAGYLHTLPPAQSGKTRPYSPTFEFTAQEEKRIQKAEPITPEASAETTAVNLPAILQLRQLFKQRSDLLRLTVNDLLVLYRAIHAVTYHPDIKLITQLQGLQKKQATCEAATAALTAIDDNSNPAILIPVDASRSNPGDRLFPLAFTVPLAELDLLNTHKHLLTLLAHGHPEAEQLQKEYLGNLAGFGEVLSRAKEIANAGQSASTGSIRMLAHMPAPLQQLLDTIPSHFDILNDMIKGREVFSNVGQVAPTSSLTRFITAKDDNEKKTLAWGVMTDANQTMIVTLRDFRPHVGLLTAVHQHDLAQHIAQDYLNAYARGLNKYISELYTITAPQNSKEAKLPKGKAARFSQSIDTNNARLITTANQQAKHKP
ncbi:MAG: hypothetical protein CSA11_10600 [Chloroflexi bacterium]|nr:MAG: hypothetical protein CSB13_04615 [Chloroflexota bacterium]PIE79821.1 MAG: hypothetical protein CSA11_10600 [Chloroflexota bacterium]